MGPPTKRMNQSPLVYAHRGASLELPENTIEAFRLALSLGADVLETDGHMTRDGRIVLAHDPTGERMAGEKKAIAASTLVEVQAWNVGARSPVAKGVTYRMPTLDEALEEFPDAFFNLDAKDTTHDMVPALLRAIRRANATARVRIASFASANVERTRALGYEGETSLTPKEIARVMFVPGAISRMTRWGTVAGKAAQIPRSAYGMRLDSQRAIDRLHVAGVRVDYWTIDDPDEAKLLFARGADGVVTNDTRKMCAAIKGVSAAKPPSTHT
jgi:glycerophosphoryl diester phosphodiesterase